MASKTVYILHKNGANSHYEALKHLLKTQDIELKYHEFSIFSTLFKALIKGKLSSVKKQLRNLVFIVKLLFTTRKAIVLAIAPFDSKLGRLLFLLKNHNVYYHTSWSYWDKSFHPKTKHVTPKVYSNWKYFLEKKALKIFTVTKQSKHQLLANYNIQEDNISVVYHALNPVFSTPLLTEKKRNSFIYLGRLLPEKGIEELLDFFSLHPQISLTIIGKGKLEKDVSYAAKHFKNITFIKHTSDIKTLKQQINNHEYVVLNSKRSKKWEELFGLIIIECMSQGLIPIAPSHTGPKEIITPDLGYIFEEGEIKNSLEDIIALPTFNQNMSLNAMAASKNYSVSAISKYWSPILN